MDVTTAGGVGGKSNSNNNHPIRKEDYMMRMRNDNNINKSGKGKKLEYSRSFMQGGRRRSMYDRYFTSESLFLLLCLTVSLLILPLVLPPLPPPPFMLLLLPICILGLLMILAFMPTSNVRDPTFTYV